MSSAFSQRMTKTATRLLSKFGSSVELVKSGGQVWDDDLGEYVNSPGEVIALTAVPVPVKSGLVDGTAIQAGDMFITVDHKTAPDMADKVRFTGEYWSIVAIERKMVNDDVIAYRLQVRK